MKEKGEGWDRGVDFEAAKARLESRLSRAKSDTEYAYLAILLVQLLNGARVSEACEAVQIYARTAETRVRVKVRKQKSPAERLIVIPRGIDLRRVAWVADVDLERLVERVKFYARTRLGLNTHSLRYAFITHMAKRGVSAQLIAKMTGHKTLSHILHYTQKIEAEKILEEIVEG